MKKLKKKNNRQEILDLNELREEYESTVLAYSKEGKAKSFSEWLKSEKNIQNNDVIEWAKEFD